MLSNAPLWERAFSLCMAARNALIVTEFFIRSASALETDGPSGAVILGRALDLLGKRVCLATDRSNLSALNLACVNADTHSAPFTMDRPARTAGEGMTPHGNCDL